MPYPDPTLYALPLFVIALALEPWLLRRVSTPERPRLGYEKRDAWASIGMGIGSMLFVSAINLGVFVLASWLWQFRLWDLGTGVLGWAVALIGWDFSYYWQHRLEHETRLLWACHVNHHSSRFYNLTTALRQPWTPWAHFAFYPGWALLGVRPTMIMIAGGVSLIYQFWIHTEVVDRGPRWVEAVFNTPSHHRVHHGSNPEYLDKNYGGILILWDRWFGSFTEERATVVYGLTKNIATFNLWQIAFHEYAALARDVRAASGLRDKLGILLHGPAWQPPSTLRD